MIHQGPLPVSPQGLLETLWLLLTSVVVVPAVCKLPGGSPVLGFLAGGALIGPHALGERSPQVQWRGGEPSICPRRAVVPGASPRQPV